MSPPEAVESADVTLLPLHVLHARRRVAVRCKFEPSVCRPRPLRALRRPAAARKAFLDQKRPTSTADQALHADADALAVRVAFLVYTASAPVRANL